MLYTWNLIKKNNCYGKVGVYYFSPMTTVTHKGGCVLLFGGIIIIGGYSYIPPI